jgi:UV excision repair protein RAD23
MGAAQAAQAQAAQAQAAQAGGGPFDFLRNHPQFNTIRQMVQQNPHLLQPLLQQLAQANPQILQRINANQAEFIRMLNEPVAPGSAPPAGSPSVGLAGTGGAGAAGAGAGAAGGAGGPGTHYIQVSPEEREAIDRLTGLGFDRSLVIQAYFACDKDETVTANYLLEHGGEEEFDASEMDFSGGQGDY